MTQKAKKAILIGIDGGMLYHIDQFVREGRMPNVARLLARGTVAEAYPQVPCDTPTNWTTLATGATSGTHGITGFYLHEPGEDLHLGQVLRDRSFLSNYCHAEYIWEAAERVGKKTLVINYPVGWPARMDQGMMMFSAGVPVHAAGGPAQYVTGDAPDEKGLETIPITLETAKADAAVSRPGRPPLRGTIPLSSPHVQNPPEPAISLVDSRGEGYDEVVITGPAEYNAASLRIRVGEWSGWLQAGVTIKPDSEGMWMRGWLGPGKLEDHALHVYVRFLLSHVNADGSGLVLRRTHLFTTTEWTYPRELGAELLTALDLGITSESVSKQVQRLGAEALSGELADSSRLTDIAQTLRALSGLYDQAARGAASL